MDSFYRLQSHLLIPILKSFEKKITCDFLKFSNGKYLLWSRYFDLWVWNSVKIIPTRESPILKKSIKLITLIPTCIWSSKYLHDISNIYGRGGNIKHINHSCSYRGLDAFENVALNMKTRPTLKRRKGLISG